MGLESVVNVSISRQTQAVSQAGFGTPAILGVAANWPVGQTAKVLSYASAAAVLVDFPSSTDEYKMAAALFSQSPRPLKVKIIKRSAPIAQVETLTPVVANSAVYNVIIDGVTYSITSGGSATASAIVAALLALINADPNVGCIASGTTTLILTAKDAGVPFVLSASANLTIVHTTASNGINEDLVAGSNEDGDFYMVLLASKADADIKALASWAESQRRMALALSNAAGIPTSGTSDIAQFLKNKNYFRTAVLYSSTAAEYLQACLAGRVLPLDPGSETWAFKGVSGATAENAPGKVFSDSQKGFLDAKNCNYMQILGGVSVSINGKVAAGDYIDVIRGIDWLQARIQENVFGKLIAADKIAFNDGGIAIIESAIREKLQVAQRVGLINPGWTVSVPKSADVSSADKAARTLNGVSFVAQVAGAIHAMNITGTVTL